MSEISYKYTDTDIWRNSQLSGLGLLFSRFRGISFTERGCQPLAQPPTWRTRSRYLRPPATVWSRYTPRHWVARHLGSATSPTQSNSIVSPWGEMYMGRHIKCPLFLSDFNEIWTFWTAFRKRLRHQISWKFVQWKPSCSMQKDGRAEREDKYDEANSRFLQFCERA